MLVRRIALGLVVLLVIMVSPAWAEEGEGPVRYDNYRLVRIYLDDWNQVQQIHDLGGLLMSDTEGVGKRPTDYLLPPEAVPVLELLDVSYVVLNDNIQRDIDAERARLETEIQRDPNDPNWFFDYKNYDQVNAKLYKMQNDRPDLATVLNLGTSQQGRQIYGIRITGPGGNKPGVQFNGGHHAREWISVMVPMWIADKLVYNYDTDPTIHSLVDQLEFFIIPIVNVDGYVYSWTNDRMWRKNRRPPPPGYSCYGVDDNRNYDANFGGPGSSGYPCDETYRGPYAFSEPETAAMRNFTIARPNIVVTHSYHSYSQLVMSPYGYTSALPADHDWFIALDQAMHDAIYAVHQMQYDYGPIYSTIYQVSGGDVDWYYDARNIFAFVTELRDTGTYGFLLPPDQIVPTCEENFAAAIVLAQWAATPIKFSFPSGLPSRLTPGVPEPVQVKIIALGGTIDPNSPRLFTRSLSGVPFTESVLTPLGGNLYQATLPATICGRTLQYYFSAASTGGLTGYSPADAPTTTYQVQALPIVTILDKNMDTNPGWTAQSLWAWGQPTGGGGEYGGPDPTSGHTGTKVYGYNLNGDYENNLPEKHLTTTAINCSGKTGVRLSFWRWLGVEQPLYDHAYLRISNNGSTWYNVWQNPTTIYDGAWVYQEFDISSWADNKPVVYLRWTMGPTDGGWRYCGWNIDDVKVWAPDPNGCPPVPGDMNCDGELSFGDINPFVMALTNPAGYQQQYPDCDINHGDVNGNGTFGFDDINPFVALFTK